MDFQQFGATPLEGRMWVDGSWFEHAGSHAIEVDNPASEALLGQVPAGDAAAVDAAGATPGEISRYWLGRAIEDIADDPARWLALMGRKLLFLTWNREIPNNQSYDFIRGEESRRQNRHCNGRIAPSDVIVMTLLRGEGHVCSSTIRHSVPTCGLEPM